MSGTAAGGPTRPAAPLVLAPVAFADPDTQALVAQVQAEYVERYGGPDESPLEDGVFAPPRGAFFAFDIENPRNISACLALNLLI